MNKELVITTYGSDPEYAVVDSNDNVVIIEEYLPGSKAQPFDLGDGIGVQPDGVAIEMTIPPCNSKKEYLDAMLLAQDKANTIVKAINPEYKIKALSSAKYAVEELEKHPNCMQFGCSKSFNAWTMGETYVPPASSVGEYRSFGSHIHCGITNLKDSDEEFASSITTLMKTLDVFVGIPSVFIDRDVDRRRIYGTAGDFRYRELKNCLVVEYRVLGGALLESEETMGWVFDAIQSGIKHYNENCNNEDYLNMLEECDYEIQNCIKTGDTNVASTICQIFDVAIPQIKIIQYATK
jgi:hypothetical protein